MIELEVKKEDLQRLRQKLDRIKDPAKRGTALNTAFVAATLRVETMLKESVSGSTLHVRSGRLRASIGSRTENDNGDITGMIGSGVRQGNRVKYADIHETGGTITPKRVSWLTIPLKAALTPAGVPRGKARDFANTFFLKKNGNLLLMQKKGDAIIPLFVLKKSVDIPARRYMSRTAADASKEVFAIMERSVKEALS